MPWSSDLHTDQALTNVSAKYRNGNYIADQIFPVVTVKKESDKLFTYGREAFQLVETIRAVKSEAREASWNVSTTTYSLNEHAIKDLVADRDRDNADAPIDLDIDTTEYLTDVIMLRREKLVADTCFTTTSWSNYASATSTARWSQLTTTSDPIGDIQTGTTIIIQQAGIAPNTLVMGYDCFKSLKNHPNILERIKYSERGIVTEDILKAVFDIPEIVVGKSIINTAQEGLTETTNFIWAHDALLLYKAPNPGLRQVSAGYLLTISGRGTTYKTKKWREEKLAGDYIEVSTMFTPKLVCTLAGYFFNDYIA